jgi:hypothetical protein
MRMGYFGNHQFDWDSSFLLLPRFFPLNPGQLLSLKFVINSDAYLISTGITTDGK